MATPAKKVDRLNDYDIDFQRDFDAKNKEAKERLQKSIEAIERSVISLVSQTFGPDATTGRRARIRQAMDMRNQLLKIFRGFYKESAQLTSGYVSSARAAIDIIGEVTVPTEFSKVDKDVVNVLQQLSYDEFENLGRTFQKKIGDEIYQAVLTDKQLPDMIDSISNSLTGIESKGGRPMTQYADQIAHDGLMKFTRAVTTQKATELGIKKFMFLGSLVDDSREFCVERAGKIFTTEEIQEWEGLDWAGKNWDVPVMVSLGGYRCRHHLVPVDDDVIEFMRSQEEL